MTEEPGAAVHGGAEAGTTEQLTHPLQNNYYFLYLLEFSISK